MKSIHLIVLACVAVTGFTSCTEKYVYYRRVPNTVIVTQQSTGPGLPYRLPEQNTASQFRAESER